MSEYLPSFIVEPVLRQARRFSERIGADESLAGATGSSFTLPAVPDFQRFYPTRFWTQPPPAAANSNEGIIDATLEHPSVAEEGTLRSIARNIQLWANQINNLDVEDDEAVQDQVLPSVETDLIITPTASAVLTEEPETADTSHGLAPVSPSSALQAAGSRSLPLLSRTGRTISATSHNPAHELSYRSQVHQQNAQVRAQSDPFVALNATEAATSIALETPRDDHAEVAYDRTRTGSGTLPEDDGMRPLRQKINAVWSGSGTAQEKSKMVHALMTERYRLTQSLHTPTSSATATSPPFRAASPLSLASLRSEETTFNLSPSDLQPTYALLGVDDVPDEITGELPKPDLGCLHYKRNVKMQCAICERWYTCRICHDEKEDHQLPRRETKHMLCMICQTPQRASAICKSCHVQSACYYCPICKLWNNDANRSIYHCDDCGICRLGEGLGKDFFHCKTCAACMSISAQSMHRCIDSSTKCDCPICGEYMFTSSQPVTFMRCGHSIHESCFEEWCNTSYKCPICSKSIANMESQFRRLDRHIEEQPMPTEYSHNRAYVFCNDCNSRSVVKYHWLGLKCAVCDSYNTAQLELLGPESPAIQERADRAQELGIGEAGMTASQNQTPNDDPMSPVSRTVTGDATSAATSSVTRQRSASGTPRSAIGVPARRDSPFHNLPHSPSRSLRAVSPVVGSYFGTGQRPPPAENRRGSYFSVLSFGTTTEENAVPNMPHAHPDTAPGTLHSRSQPSRLSQSYLLPPSDLVDPAPGADATDLRRGSAALDDDDDMDFWGGQSPRSHDADVVDLDLEGEEEEESSSDEDEEMVSEDDEGDEDDDPMDILIGHR